ncbi:MAG: flagellar assembly protein FliX [Alphaproteobacteria bacterium]|nr:flagellar assembly protein FliX [Alphaproteobacteria bacterium]
MRISKTSSSSSTQKTGKSKKAGKSSASDGIFSSNLSALMGAETPAAGASSNIEAPTAIHDISSILAAQDISEDLASEAKKRNIKRGKNLLDNLDEIRIGLLTGSIPKEKLINIAQQLRNKRDKECDPKLSEILDDIELRVEVEIAKLSK